MTEPIRGGLCTTRHIGRRSMMLAMTGGKASAAARGCEQSLIATLKSQKQASANVIAGVSKANQKATDYYAAAREILGRLR